MNLTDLGQDWLSQRQSGGTPQDAEVWMSAQGIKDRIADQLAPVLAELWTDAFKAGVQSAAQAAGQQIPPGAMQQLAGLLAGQSAAWAAQIAHTTVSLLAAALAGAAVGIGLAALVKLLKAVLSDLERAKSIAQTEITRVMAIAAQIVYRLLGIHYVEWVTEHDAKVCPACQSNQDAGRHPLGVPFPSGAPWPPGHVRCRCALVPA